MPPAAKKASYRFTFGPWNISTGADPFGPPVRKEVAFAAKIREYKKLGFDGVQFHDDDVVEADLPPAETMRGAAKVKKLLEGEGLFCEFIAPRLWEHPKTIDGGYTSNSASDRKYAIERSYAIDTVNPATPNLQAWADQYYGVMKFRLFSDGYSWDYESALESPTAPAGTPPSYSDAGRGTCHGGRGW